MHAVNDFLTWFSGSEVVDAAGAPLVVYHGTREVFTEFLLREREHWVGPGMNDVQSAGHVMFTSSPKAARTYGPHVMRVYLALRNPLVLDAKGESYRTFVPFHHIGEALVGGFDGVIVHNIRDDARMGGAPATTYIALSAAQIRLANDRPVKLNEPIAAPIRGASKPKRPGL